MRGMVFNIQRFSIHDGPGIRTTVFLKGCNLHCFWCHNPESISPKPEIQFFSAKCAGCGKCFEVCPQHAHVMQDGQRIFKRDLCRACGLCADACCWEALELTGKTMTVEEVIQEVERDQPFYENSGGGVTFSGGEPLLQKDFLMALLSESKKKGFHTAIDTAGNVPWESFEAVLPLTDLFLFDMKAYDPVKHKSATGADPARIRENIRRLGMQSAEVWVRIPVIPGINDSIEDMTGIAEMLTGLKSLQQVELLPFHSLGEGKYKSLGREYDAKELTPPGVEQLTELMEPFKARGITVKKGS